MTSLNPLHDCTIVWICPLEVELRAAIAMLDKESSEMAPRARGQNVIYTVGEIGPHKVAVVGYYQEQGLAVSGSIAAEVKRDLPNLQFGLLVGVAGGIPSSAHDIQLGDVAVAVPEDDCPGVVGYDLGKEREDGHFELKHWQDSTNTMLRSAINIVRARNPHRFRQHLAVVERRPEFRRPDSGLTHASRAHPEVHYGIILSGNTVIKSKAKRDQLRSQYGGIAVEMEAAGMMTRLHVAVIRGISDFADASKTKEWQPYAAIAAAAYAKEVLLSLPPENQKYAHSREIHQASLREVSSTPFATRDLRLARVLPEKWAFFGRSEEMAFLEKELGFRAQPPIQRLAVGLWGLAGIGKSQLAAQFVGQQCSNHPEREIFWLNGETQESFNNSISSMLKAREDSIPLGHATSAISSMEKRRHLVNLFLAELNRLEDARWLLVIDGIVESSSQGMDISLDIQNFVSGLARGSVLLTSRRRDVVARYYPCQQVKGLKTADAIELLKHQVPPQLTGNGDSNRVLHRDLFLTNTLHLGIENLATLLNNLPLALRLAASSITHYRCTVEEYSAMWKTHSQSVRILGTDDVLSRSMALSFDELEKTEPTAAKILTLLSFLHHRDFWFELCHNADEDIFPSWLQGLARERAPFIHFCPILADLSFIELRHSTTGSQIWEMHPVVQIVAMQRARSNEQDYIRCAIALVAAQVPRSFEANSWEITRRLWPHAEICWRYIKQGRWGPEIDYTDLESLARVFRRVGQYENASLIYERIKHGLSGQYPTRENAEFLADVLTNLGLVYTRQLKFDLALDCFDKSAHIMSQLNILTPDASFSLMYNTAVVFMMTGRLDEAEKFLRRAAAHFSQQAEDTFPLAGIEQNDLSIRILNDLGEVLMQQGSVEEALSLFHRIHDSQRKYPGELNPTSISLKQNIGRALSKLGRFAEARSSLLGVIEVYTEWWGRRHLETMRAIEELAWTLMREGDELRVLRGHGDSEMRMAGTLWNELFVFYQSVDGDGSEAVARAQENLRLINGFRTWIV